MPNQYIEENLMHIQSLIVYRSDKRLAGIIKFIHFEKGF